MISYPGALAYCQELGTSNHENTYGKNTVLSLIKSGG